MRTIIAWLNKRFPEVLTVTKQDWTELREEVAQYNRLYQAFELLEKRVQDTEKKINILSAAQGFTSNANGSAFGRLER